MVKRYKMMQCGEGLSDDRFVFDKHEAGEIFGYMISPRLVFGWRREEFLHRAADDFGRNIGMDFIPVREVFRRSLGCFDAWLYHPDHY